MRLLGVVSTRSDGLRFVPVAEIRWIFFISPLEWDLGIGCFHFMIQLIPGMGYCSIFRSRLKFCYSYLDD